MGEVTHEEPTPLELANARADKAEFDMHAAQVELARIKAAMAWTLGKLRIADLFGSANETGPVAADGWLPGLYGAPEVAADCHRLDWINTHARVGALNSRDVFLVFPGPRLDGEVPDVFNIRHILDLCSQNHP